ncbi:MAG: 1-deoxy-D-xylulose-5-phosphate reductoisomerase [Acidobacteria bacterium]|nr:1-deoxy-D-xylulose-5-phosphate reductoisomerase [Acidobacteriota bacterium]
MKFLSILGSTGSIGRSTLQVVEALRERFAVAGLSAGRNVEHLTDQVQRFRPEVVSVADEKAAKELEGRLASMDRRARPTILHGTEGAVAVATHPRAQTVISGLSGGLGLVPTYRGIEAGKDIALANKETLVMAGAIMTDLARRKGVHLLPVDSEHNAILQCLQGVSRDQVKRFILTASGGPFLKTPVEELENVSPEEALAHPTWKMGKKITIDSATLMNKGLEVIEASWLFGASPDEIHILIHPQSIVHSLVEMVDGSVMAQMGITDMRLAIQYALTYPERLETRLPPLSLSRVRQLEFYEPDLAKFPCIHLAYEALRIGGTMPAVLNAADEVAVSAFVDEKIRFTDIPRVVRRVMQNHQALQLFDLETLLEVDTRARQQAAEMIQHQFASVF